MFPSTSSIDKCMEAPAIPKITCAPIVIYNTINITSLITTIRSNSSSENRNYLFNKSIFSAVVTRPHLFRYLRITGYRGIARTTNKLFIFRTPSNLIRIPCCNCRADGDSPATNFYGHMDIRYLSKKSICAHLACVPILINDWSASPQNTLLQAKRQIQIPFCSIESDMQ